MYCTVLVAAVYRYHGNDLFPLPQAPQMSKKEIEDLLRKGAYGAVMEEDDDANKFCEEDIDQILERRTHVIQLDSEAKGSSFAKVLLSLVIFSLLPHLLPHLPSLPSPSPLPPLSFPSPLLISPSLPPSLPSCSPSPVYPHSDLITIATTSKEIQ